MVQLLSVFAVASMGATDDGGPKTFELNFESGDNDLTKSALKTYLPWYLS